MYKTGRVGGFFDTRGLRTDRSYNYKLAATWLTPEVIRASSRLAQLRSRLPAEAARKLVAEAEAVVGTAVLVEIDPREGSGVIPLSWDVFLQPKGALPDSGQAVTGRKAPRLRNVRGLAGTRRRNYDYEQFWIVFPLALDDGRPLFMDDVKEVELVVRIYDKEGRVEWRVPDSVRTPD